MQECARAVLLTSERRLLLMLVAGRERGLWITPGGRIQPGETPVAALRRELAEETGGADFEIGPLIWIRYGMFVSGGRPQKERERIYLVRTPSFEPVTSGMEPEETGRFRGYRWWSVSAIQSSSELFAPRRMGELLGDLLQDLLDGPLADLCRGSGISLASRCPDSRYPIVIEE